MTATTSEVHAVGREAAVRVLQQGNARRIGVNFETHTETVREAFGRLPLTTPIDRTTAAFWLNLSRQQLERRTKTIPPPSPYVYGQHGKAPMGAVADWHATWLPIEDQMLLDEELDDEVRARTRIEAQEDARLEDRLARLKAKSEQRKEDRIARDIKNIRRRYEGKGLVMTHSWLVQSMPAGNVVLGNAEALTLSAADIVSALQAGAMIRRMTPQKALQRPWASARDREAWEHALG